LAAKVPCIPGSDGLVEDIDEGLKIAEKIKYAIIIKATAGGGGKGMRIVRNPEDIEKSWNSARQEAKSAFGNDGLYNEKLIEETHHIEIRMIGDQHGKVAHLGERYCSIQRRHKKLVEESPSPFMTPRLRDKMGKAAIK